MKELEKFAKEKKVKYFVGVDIDSAVLENPTTHKNIVMSSEKIPVDNNFFFACFHC